MITRRAFIKGMGALALLLMIPAMVEANPYGEVAKESAKLTNDEFKSEISSLLADDLLSGEPLWDSTGTMTIPHVEDGERTDYKVRYTVTEDGTEAEIVE